MEMNGHLYAPHALRQWKVFPPHSTYDAEEKAALASVEKTKFPPPKLNKT
jgi:hypothetical protein